MIKNDELEKIAFLDSITGLPNFQALIRDYKGKSLDNVHFIYVNLDDSSTMNVIFGSDAVNDILDEVSKTLLDYCGKSRLYRVGHDQFLMLTESHIICKPSELQRILRQPVKRNGNSYQVKASICVLDYDDFKGDSLEELFDMMQFIINLENRNEKNKLVFADQQFKNLFLEKNEIEKNIFAAVRNKDFFPKFQPFVDNFTNEIVGFEAVSRWNLNGKVLKPDKYLEIAEWTSLIYAIEMQMLREAISFYNELQDDSSIKISKRFKASLNFSEYTLKHVKTKKLVDLILQSGNNTQDFIIEIHESFITNVEAYDKVKELHDAGFNVLLDEYTNTSSSLTYLADLKVDILKLSECLLKKIDSTQEYSRMHSVYKFMADIGKKFHLTIVSAGLDKSEHVKIAKDLGINIGTGKYYSKAVEKAEFIELFTKIKVKR